MQRDFAVYLCNCSLDQDNLLCKNYIRVSVRFVKEDRECKHKEKENAMRLAAIELGCNNYTLYSQHIKKRYYYYTKNIKKRHGNYNLISFRKSTNLGGKKNYIGLPCVLKGEQTIIRSGDSQPK